MEASENNTPQLNLDEPVGDGNVAVVGDRIRIDGLMISDEQVARVVRDRREAGHAPADTVRKSIEIGARLVEGESAAANVDFVNSQFERHMGRLTEQLATMLTEGNDEFVQALAANFDPESTGSVQQQIREMLVKATEHQQNQMVRMFNADDGINPLADFKASVTSKVADAAQRNERQAEALRESHQKESKELRDQIAGLQTVIARLTERTEGDELIAEAEEAGTRKGRTFEDLVHDEIESLASGHDDVAHHVGHKATESGAKKGDTLLELGAATGAAQGSVVFEAKNRQLSKNEAWAELNAVIGERDADFGVLVVAGDDKVPKGLEELTEYQGNKMIVVVDRDDPDTLALRLVYRYVRARVLAARSGALEVDAAGVRSATEDAQARLKCVNRIRKSLTGITNNADKVREDVDEMVDGVGACLARVEELISEAAEEAEADELAAGSP